jgi:hypothetical protein
VAVPNTLGVCTTTHAVSESIASITAASLSTSGARRTVLTPATCAVVSVVATYCGCTPPERIAFFRRVTRLAIITASAVEVEPSYMEALATSMPVRFATWVWNS